ncbi:hypothetical protein B0J13DRAFT_612766 [Dactylonectria estremocensis]|uniref:Peptidase metallopeptidase domain-containing protein n=1 Tax=Dactylonectria estremocensis TaxID=1079267 RepID=A0A9P9DJN6_9HYPO|nr:hypothetical protein B0J13DRAFT_612766 [Dactylonectria estremocensis]
MYYIRFCTQIPVPPNLQVEADILAVRVNPLNGHQITTGGLLPGLGGMKFMAVPVGWEWRNDRMLRVKSLNSSEEIESKIRLYANLWTEYANMNFGFVGSGDAKICINIGSSNASNSLSGTNNLNRKDQSTPTMNFSWLKNTSMDPEFCSVIFHEFGHAVGLVHEHQSPGVEINWNKRVVYEYHRQIDHWDKNTVDANLFIQCSWFSTSSTTFVPLSIMVYEPLKQLILDGFSIGQKPSFLIPISPSLALDTHARTLISRLSAHSSMAGVTSGWYDTTIVGLESQPQLNNSGRLDFPAETFSEVSKILIALDSLNIDNRHSLRLKGTRERSLLKQKPNEASLRTSIDLFAPTTNAQVSSDIIRLDNTINKPVSADVSKVVTDLRTASGGQFVSLQIPSAEGSHHWRRKRCLSDAFPGKLIATVRNDFP